MRRRLHLLVVTGLTLLLVGPLVTRPAAGAPAQEQLPNLVPMAPTSLEIRLDDDRDLPALRFDASIWNRGGYAFELLGRPKDPSPTADAAAEQCVAWVTTKTCAERRNIGVLSYHEDHGHYHFEDFALYELRRFRKNGRVDMRPRGLVATSIKVSFCLQDVRRSDEAEPTHATPWPMYYGCFSGMGMQGISPGWIDVYGPRTTGQALPLTGVADGLYALVIHTDPGGRVFESNDEDNVSVTGVMLTEAGSKVAAFCYSEPGSLTCDRAVDSAG